MFKHFHRHHRSDRAQSLLEFTVLTIIVMAVFLSMVSYMKRGIQGRWKTAVDDLGDQYDPRQTASNAQYSAVTYSNTIITTDPAPGGYFTNRVDQSHSLEQRNSYMQVGQEGDDFGTTVK